MLIFWAIFLAIWIVCGAFAYAANFGWYQRSWPEISKATEQDDFVLAMFFGLWGPFSLFAAWADGMFEYGLKWKRQNLRER